MEEIKSDDGKIIAIVVKRDFEKEGVNFISKPDFPLQLGVIFHINIGHFNTPLFRLCLTIYNIFDYKLR